MENGEWLNTNICEINIDAELLYTILDMELPTNIWKDFKNTFSRKTTSTLNQIVNQILGSSGKLGFVSKTNTPFSPQTGPNSSTS